MTLLSWVGDGACDDVTNIADCNYDGGDCCGNLTYQGACIECQCLEVADFISSFIIF